MVWALFRVALFGGSFLIGVFFFGPAAPVHGKNETTISVSHKSHKNQKREKGERGKGVRPLVPFCGTRGLTPFAPSPFSLL